ncbi:MAG: (d)CMP kinase [Coxiellaceae bacterium]|nr:(d)CMP kinase [Coxiellaceae bacterium]
MSNQKKPPVITIDGTSGCGKGTLAHLLANKLQWHYLDSGALYRIAAWATLQADRVPEDSAEYGDFIQQLPIKFKFCDNEAGFLAYCDNTDVSQAIRSEQVSEMASKVSALPVVRKALIQQQYDFRQMPGLVTDGRDMGTVVFPDADVKLYLTANLKERANRRYQQLTAKGEDVQLGEIQSELEKRDARDMSRTNSPLKPAGGALIIDTSDMTIDQVFDLAMQQAKPFCSIQP